MTYARWNECTTGTKFHWLDYPIMAWWQVSDGDNPVGPLYMLLPTEQRYLWADSIPSIDRDYYEQRYGVIIYFDDEDCFIKH